jgi:hypothetical protein
VARKTHAKAVRVRKVTKRTLPAVEDAMIDKASDKGSVVGTAKCAICNFFVLAPDLEPPGSGRCHFYPPSSYRDYGTPTPAHWPPVASSDWCGQYQVKTGG